jgi:integrase
LQGRSGKHNLKATRNRTSRRTARLAPETVESLNGLRKRAVASGVYGPDKPVFADCDGGFLRKSNLQRRHFDPAVTRAGVKSLTFHGLRHTAASTWLAGVASIKAVSARLGHTDANATQQVYSHLLPDDDQRIIEVSRKTLFAPAAKNGNQMTTSGGEGGKPGGPRSNAE